MWCVCVCVCVCVCLCVLVSVCMHCMLTYVLEWAADAASLCSARRWRFSIICSTPTPSARRSALSCNIWPISTQHRIYVIPFINKYHSSCIHYETFLYAAVNFTALLLNACIYVLIIVRGYMHSIMHTYLNVELKYAPKFSCEC